MLKVGTFRVALTEVFREIIGKKLTVYNYKFIGQELRIKFEANLNKGDKYQGGTSLFWAVNDGYTECVKILLAAGADIYKADLNGQMPLHVAAENGHLECVKILLAAGADPNRSEQYGNTPLYTAAYWGHTECFKALLAAGADPKRANNKDETPLIIAQERGRPEIVKILEEAMKR